MPDLKNGSIFPQKPFHRLLFKSSSPKINLVCNPQKFYPNNQL